VVAVSAQGKDLAAVKAATPRFHRPEVARAAGWDLVPGLDFCFENPAGGMGFHYINQELLNNAAVDPLQPEAMVYVPGPHGKLRLGAVEWIVKAEQVDPANPPVLFGQTLHLDTDDGLPVYVLHAWIFKENPTGVFEDWNPKISCPAP
jgi:hypothetical protein